MDSVDSLEQSSKVDSSEQSFKRKIEKPKGSKFGGYMVLLFIISIILFLIVMWARKWQLILTGRYVPQFNLLTGKMVYPPLWGTRYD